MKIYSGSNYLVGGGIPKYVLQISAQTSLVWVEQTNFHLNVYIKVFHWLKVMMALFYIWRCQKPAHSIKCSLILDESDNIYQYLIDSGSFNKIQKIFIGVYVLRLSAVKNQQLYHAMIAWKYQNNIILQDCYLEFFF